MPPRSPEPAALRAAAENAGARAYVEAARLIAGGSHARTWLLRIANPAREVVLREFPPGDPAGTNEARVLTILDGLGGLAPRLIANAADENGSWVVITRLPGQADIRPADPHRFATELGTTLARLHRTPLPALSGLDSLHDRWGGSRRRPSGPAAGLVLEAWDQILTTRRVLTHYDFQSGNVLWEGDTLSGVVDWEGAVLGPPGYDIGWARFDLFLLYGEQLADVFLNAYNTIADIPLEDPGLWDLWTIARSHVGVEDWVPNYHDLGRPDLTATELRRRHTWWTNRTLAKRR
ncbi:aminoglycoside phosphotransferase family protein [Prauserella shujinwangii]|uniref:aminoglycoside phosphotransferase family protein n=1 Tax=Prauserella shujinwangii TaxID=1453103 RepID=UPI000D085C56|nr:aminoglycoside phosphotransferase family protein [Prauserella shujinwangii]